VNAVDPVRILIVDDDRFDRELATVALHEAGIDGCPPVITCADGWTEAKRLLEREPFDLMLLDYNLPGVTGLEILRELAAGPHPPVAMLTGQDDLATAIETIRAGAYDYVPKRTDWGATLACAVERILARVRLERQLADARRRLAAYAGELEQKVAVRTAVVRTQAARIEELYLAAEAAARVKAEIVANVSHELRTPLDVILGYTDLLEGSVPRGEPSEMLAKVRVQADRLRGLVESLLALGSLNDDDDHVHATPFDLAALVAEVRAEADGLNADRALRLEWTISPAPCRIVHDREKVRAIAYHLVGNAIKFTPEGRVDIAFSTDPAEGLTIAVSDTGVGLPPEARALAFEDFRQVDGSSTRTYAGLGLGLGIVRRYAALLRGRISVADRPGGGTTIVVALPAPRPARALRRPEP
jgi:signal transduction histidine kinase